jgi:hypothetical protein
MKELTWAFCRGDTRQHTTALQSIPSCRSVFRRAGSSAYIRHLPSITKPRSWMKGEGGLRSHTPQEVGLFRLCRWCSCCKITNSGRWIEFFYNYVLNCLITSFFCFDFFVLICFFCGMNSSSYRKNTWMIQGFHFRQCPTSALTLARHLVSW